MWKLMEWLMASAQKSTPRWLLWIRDLATNGWRVLTIILSERFKTRVTRIRLQPIQPSIGKSDSAENATMLADADKSIVPTHRSVVR